MNDNISIEFKSYLRRLGWSLASLPEQDRNEIVEETRFHVMSRVEQGRTIGEVLSALGPPERYAQVFIDEMELAGALVGRRPLRSMTMLMRRAHLSLTAAMAIIGVGTLFILGLTGAIGLVAKPFDPQHVGLWTSARGDFFVGTTDPGYTGHELLGNWIYPAGLLDLAVTWFLAQRIVIWAVRRLAHQNETAL